MKIEITMPGIRDGEGKSIPIGTIIEVKEEPLAWRPRYRVIGAAPEDAEPVTNKDPETELDLEDADSIVDAAGEEGFSLEEFSKEDLLTMAATLDLTDVKGNWGVDRIREALEEELELDED